MKTPARARKRKTRLRKGRGLLFLAFGSFFDAVVDGFAAFLFRATLFVAFPASLFHQRPVRRRI